jgi:hypothetical protein
VQDSLRIRIVEVLLLLKACDVDFLDFPHALFAASTINSMTSLKLTKDPGLRADFVCGGLILLTCVGSSVSNWDITENDYAELCAPLMAPMERNTGMLEMETLFIPFAVQYFVSLPAAHNGKLRRHFVHNLLIALDWFNESDMLTVVRICQVLEIEV